MTYHKIQTQREPDIEVLVSETSFAMGFKREGQVVNRWVALPHGGGFGYFGHYLGTVELVSPSEAQGFDETGLR